MIRTQIYITPEQHKKLKLIYAESGQKITESIRQAIEVYLNDKNLLKVRNKSAVK
jgi:hypothetical protein